MSTLRPTRAVVTKANTSRPTTLGDAFRAEGLVIGLEGGVAVVSGRAAALLLDRADLDRYWREQRGTDYEVDATLLALRRVAAAWRMQQQLPVVPVTDLREFSTAQAAKRLSCSPQAVRKAIHDGRLRARMSGARYVITEEDLKHFEVVRNSS